MTDLTTDVTTDVTTAGGTPRASDGKAPLSVERADLLESLGKHRFFLRLTTRDLTDEQAALRTTSSRLCLGGLIKHVTRMEERWINFVLERPGGLTEASPEAAVEHETSFEMLPGETLDGLLARYAAVAAETDELVGTIDLDHSVALPPAPWFPPGARWTARRVLLHIIAETSQHAGHADIIRESLDGARSMG